MAIDTTETGERAVERGSRIADELAGTTRNAVDDVAPRTRKTVDQVAEGAADVADRLGSQANEALEQALRYTSAHPLQALAVVLVAGFVVGRLSRRY